MRSLLKEVSRGVQVTRHTCLGYELGFLLVNLFPSEQALGRAPVHPNLVGHT